MLLKCRYYSLLSLVPLLLPRINSKNDILTAKTSRLLTLKQLEA